MENSHISQNLHRIVVKIGSSTLTHPTGKLNLHRIEVLARTLSDLKNRGHEVVLVSSGAVSAGIARLGLTHRPRSAEEKQALAAVGQSQLMKIYEQIFGSYGYCVGQILMTKDVLDDLTRRAAAQNTFEQLIGMGCIPIVNENDSVSSEELNFGGNDTLSAYVALVTHADLLVNLSDIDGLYDSDPRKNPNAKKIDRVEKIDDTIYSYAGGAGTERGTGGMVTKIKAAAIVAEKGIPMVIVNGTDPEILYDIIEGKCPGTYFCALSKGNSSKAV
ncbi:MAG: glutamate 5-kinase [Clostridiales bacterium]|nr:glutamate 5-kinase [Clostridiales bacterium]